MKALKSVSLVTIFRCTMDGKNTDSNYYDELILAGSA